MAQTVPDRQDRQYGMGNQVKPYKGRKLRSKEPVEIYRNLRGGSAPYSVRQRGLVIGHATLLTLSRVTFVVQPSGRQRVLRSGRRNVHAFARGLVEKQGVCGTTAERVEQRLARNQRDLPAKITYDPKQDATFVCRNLVREPFEVRGAGGVVFTPHGVWAAYTQDTPWEREA